MFSFLKNTFSSLFSSLSGFFSNLFNKSSITIDDIKELEKELLSNDFGYQTTTTIINTIKAEAQKDDLSGSKARSLMLEILKNILIVEQTIDYTKKLHVLIGVNGAGKTSTTIKLATYYKNLNKTVLVVAADTFRAAAQEQLMYSAKQHHIDFIVPEDAKDPATAVYRGIIYGLENNYDHIIIDTAGRLQTKVNLMKELEKVKRIINKLISDDQTNYFLIIDSLLGQNSIDQATIFNEVLKLNGIILTKTDSMHKPGVIFTIVNLLKIPIAFVTYGEQPKHIGKFSSYDFIERLFN